MGLLWRLFAPRPLKKARRAMHPSWVIEDAIVRSVRGSKKRRSPRPSRQAQPARQPLRQSPQPAPSSLPPPAGPKRPQAYTATLIFPDGGQRPCCAAGHPTQESARRHAEQVVAESQEARRNYGVQEKDPVTSSAEILEEGTETLYVVGEMHYQRNLWELVGGRGDPRERVRKEIIAVMHPETDNPFDPNAISVWVSTPDKPERTLKAGHLSRDDARGYRPGLITKTKELGRPVALRGAIAGGVADHPLPRDLTSIEEGTKQRDNRRVSLSADGRAQYLVSQYFNTYPRPR